MFSASRGLSRRGKMKRQERDLCRLPTSSLSRTRSRFLNNQWRFCHVRHSQDWEPVWIWAGARAAVEFERAPKILNGPIRVEDETTLRAAVVADPIRGKPKRRILRQIFRSSRVFRPPKHTFLEWNLLGFMELLVLLRFGTFLFEEKAICGVTSTSYGRRSCLASRGLSRRGKRYAVARRKTRKRIASFKETKYDFSL